MAKRGRPKKEEAVAGEQLDLIDVAPENAKEIITAAREYKAAQVKRIAALEREVERKQELLSLVRDANLQRLKDGTIRFRLDGFLITVTPRDELVKVKQEEETE